MDKMIDRGFAVVNEGTSTIKDIMSFPRLCQVSLSMDDDGQGQVRVRLASVDAPEDKGAYSQNGLYRFYEH